MNILPLTEVYDSQAVKCKESSMQLGALSCRTYMDGQFRIIYAVEPIDGKLMHHVSVSNRGVSVNNKTLTEYAAKLIPQFDQMAMDSATCQRYASHMWFVRKYSNQ